MNPEKVFAFLLDNSITALWVVLAVLLLRPLLKKLSKRVAVFLWALPALRLVLTFSVQSVISLIPSRELVPENIVSAPLERAVITVPTIQSTAHAVGNTVAQTQSAAPVSGSGITLMQAAGVI